MQTRYIPNGLLGMSDNATRSGEHQCLMSSSSDSDIKQVHLVRKKIDGNGSS